MVQPVGGVGNQFFSFFAGVFAAQWRTAVLAVELGGKDSGVTNHGVSIASFRLSELTDQKIAIDLETLPKIRRLFFIRSTIFRLLTGRRFSRISRHYTSSTAREDEKVLSNSKPEILFLRGHFIWQFLLDYMYSRTRGKQLELLRESPQLTSLQSEMASEKPICLHIRRGDFLRPGSEQIALPLEYFYRALSLEEFENRPVWVFTDEPSHPDIASLEKKYDVQVISRAHNLSPEEEFLLLTRASALICSNSTFSVVAATLGAPELVVTPDSFGANQTTLSVPNGIAMRSFDL